MNAIKTTTRTTEDTKRRAFSPIHMDLVERLTRECDNLSSGLSNLAPDRATDRHKLAA